MPAIPPAASCDGGAAGQVAMSRVFAPERNRARAGDSELLAWLPASYMRDGPADWPATWALTHMMATTSSAFRGNGHLVLDSRLTTHAFAGSMAAHHCESCGQEQAVAARPVASPRPVGSSGDDGSRLLFLHENLVARVSDNLRLLRQLVAHALREAAASKRLLVLPMLPCNASWVVQHPRDEQLVWDARARIGGPTCYNGLHGWSMCWPGSFYALAFEPGVAARRAAAVQHGA